ncbi:hypothetical protein QQF64_034722, partial [Cirrhinus molitorella]
MAPLRYLRVVYARARGDGEGAGWKSCVSAVGPLRTINHSLLDGQREEGGRRNSLDSICPHLRYNGLINGSGSVSVFGVVPVLFASAPSRDGELLLSFQRRSHAAAVSGPLQCRGLDKGKTDSLACSLSAETPKVIALGMNMSGLSRLNITVAPSPAPGFYQGVPPLGLPRASSIYISIEQRRTAMKPLSRSGLDKRIAFCTLNNNNITLIPLSSFNHMPKLRTLRLHSNNLHCDCHLSWLSDWLRQRRGLAPFTQCMAPAHMRGLNVPDVQKREFVCTGPTQTEPRSCAPQAAICPAACTCNSNIVDCRKKGLTEIPANLPEGIVEIRLEQNMIKSIPAGAFSTYKKLKRIDLSKNQISEIAEDAFSGLRSLTSLVLYGNKIAEIPKGLFDGLVSLQLLLLNANKINCLRVNTFKDLQNLNLLSLYDNKLQTISKGLFTPLRSIKTLHLAQNPFMCDCHLKWLADYLFDNPIETSGARCSHPRRLANKRISQVKGKKFRCT